MTNTVIELGGKKIYAVLVAPYLAVNPERVGEFLEQLGKIEMSLGNELVEQSAAVLALKHPHLGEILQIISARPDQCAGIVKRLMKLRSSYREECDTALEASGHQLNMDELMLDLLSKINSIVPDQVANAASSLASCVNERSDLQMLVDFVEVVHAGAGLAGKVNQVMAKMVEGLLHGSDKRNRNLVIIFEEMLASGFNGLLTIQS